MHSGARSNYGCSTSPIRPVWRSPLIAGSTDFSLRFSFDMAEVKKITIRCITVQGGSMMGARISVAGPAVFVKLELRILGWWISGHGLWTHLVANLPDRGRLVK